MTFSVPPHLLGYQHSRSIVQQKLVSATEQYCTGRTVLLNLGIVDMTDARATEADEEDIHFFYNPFGKAIVVNE